MSDDQGNAAGYLGWFFFGTVLGAAAALLLAPRTGQETRELLTQQSGEVAKKAGEFAAEAQGRAGEWLDKSRELFEEQTQRLLNAFEAGRTRCARKSARARRRRVPELELPNPEELEERREKRFSRRVALTTAIYAVVLAIASLGGNNAMKEMLLAQQQSSDQWAFYQAKVIREHQYRGLRLQLETQLAEPSSLKGSERAKLDALAKRFGEEEKRYNTEKKDIEAEAKRLERERDRHRNRDPYFDFAEVFLQIAIVTASVAILSTSRPMFWFSLVLAVIGAVLTANGFTQLFVLPFLHH